MCVRYRALSVWVVITASGVPTAQVILAGDAAHVFAPATGMRLNLAIHDGSVAARYLADAIGHGNRPDTLDRSEQACKPLAERPLKPELGDPSRP